MKTTVNLQLKNYMHTQFRMQMTVRSQANRGNNFNSPPVIYANVFEYYERCNVKEARLKNSPWSGKKKAFFFNFWKFVVSSSSIKIHLLEGNRRMTCNNVFRNELSDEYFNTLKMYHGAYCTRKLFSNNEDIRCQIIELRAEFERTISIEASLLF